MVTGATLIMQVGSAALSDCAHVEINLGIMIVALSTVFGLFWLLIQSTLLPDKYPAKNWRHTLAFAIQLTLLFVLMDWAGQCTTIASTHYLANKLGLFACFALAYRIVIWIHGKVFPVKARK